MKEKLKKLRNDFLVQDLPLAQKRYGSSLVIRENFDIDMAKDVLRRQAELTQEKLSNWLDRMGRNVWYEFGEIEWLVSDAFADPLCVGKRVDWRFTLNGRAFCVHRVAAWGEKEGLIFPRHLHRRNVPKNKRGKLLICSRKEKIMQLNNEIIKTK